MVRSVNNYQITGMIILALFYAAYFIKMLGQRKRGIQTTQFGLGDKARKTVLIEKGLQTISIVIVAVEVFSIFWNTENAVRNELRIAGLVAAGIGTAVFITAMFTMQDSWRAGIAEKGSTSLVTKGIYRISRNPAFLGFDLVYLGMCIAFFNPVLLLISILGVVMMHLQILEEEKSLPEVFGEAYITYRNEVGRYFIWF